MFARFYGTTLAAYQPCWRTLMSGRSDGCLETLQFIRGATPQPVRGMVLGMELYLVWLAYGLSDHGFQLWNHPSWQAPIDSIFSWLSLSMNSTTSQLPLRRKRQYKRGYVLTKHERNFVRRRQEKQEAAASLATAKEISLCCSCSNFIKSGGHFHIERRTKNSTLLPDLALARVNHHGIQRRAM